jgi:hypothetical protein
MELPKHMLCYKNGQIIVRPILRFETSAPHLDDGRAGPTRSIPYLEQGESMIYDQNGKVVIVGSWDDRKIFIDGGSK